MFPGSFQFSDTYLVYIWDALTTSLFGTFAFNSPHDSCVFPMKKTDGSVTMTTTVPLPYLFPSAWDWSRHHSDYHISLMYDPLYAASCDLDIAAAVSNGRKLQHGITVTRDNFQLKTAISDLCLWSLCYLRWLTPVMIVGGGPACEYLTQCLLVEEITQLQQQISHLEQASKGEDKRRSILVFGAGGGAATDVVDEAVLAGETRQISSSFPFVPRLPRDKTQSALSQVPSLDTYLVSSELLSSDVASIALTHDSASASLSVDDDDDYDT